MSENVISNHTGSERTCTQDWGLSHHRRKTKEGARFAPGPSDLPSMKSG